MRDLGTGLDWPGGDWPVHLTGTPVGSTLHSCQISDNIISCLHVSSILTVLRNDPTFLIKCRRKMASHHSLSRDTEGRE